jgi:hypothetical protein
MTDRAPIEEANLDGYGSPSLPWSRAHDFLAACTPHPGTPFFLGTSRPDGRPHSAGIGAVWHDGDLYFTSGAGTRKARNLEVNPTCTISARLPDIDLVCEGEASRVVDRPTLEALAQRYRAGGWPAEVAADAFTGPYRAPSAGPPPWHLYRFTVRTAFGVATAQPYGATRWSFAA